MNTRLIAARARKGWSQKQAAQHLGVDPLTLHRWEQGKVMPRHSSIARLCEVYNCAAHVLFADSNENTAIITGTTTMTDNLSASVRQDLTARLMQLVFSWRHSQYQELQSEIDHTIDDYARIIEEDVDQVVTRRNALRSLVLLPVTLCSATSATSRRAEDILVQCAAGIAAGWYFRKGRELDLVNEALAMYIPSLKQIAETSTVHRKAAASLLVQCFILKATLARHIETHDASVAYLQAAVKYSDVAEDTLLRILSWRTLAATYFYSQRHDLALNAFERSQAILAKSKNVAMLVHSYVYAGLATMQAQLSRSDDALASLSLAHKTFFAQRPDDRIPIWVDHHMPNLLLNDGLTHHHIGDQKKALDSFAQMDSIADKSEMIRVESLLDRAMAEVSRDDRPRDMDYTINYWQQGLEGAKALRSEQWFGDARGIYTMLRAAWPGEPRVKELRELLVHW